jgi:3-oxoacyl-[acyl-carrier protein] reductase
MSNNSCVMITGSSRGLGLALATAYLAAGNQVLGCSRGASAIEHANYRHYSVDVSDELSITNMFDDMRVRKLVPRLLINNAALAQMKLTTFTSTQLASDILHANLLGTFLICREMLKLMQRHRFGRIVNLSSISVPLATVGNSLYNATKAGLDAMGHSLANECKAYDITVNCIGLSHVANTGMADALNQAAIDALQVLLMKPKLLDTSEIVAAIDFFASPHARNITGQVLYFGGVR